MSIQTKTLIGGKTKKENAVVNARGKRVGAGAKNVAKEAENDGVLIPPAGNDATTP